MTKYHPQVISSARRATSAVGRRLPRPSPGEKPRELSVGADPELLMADPSSQRNVRRHAHDVRDRHDPATRSTVSRHEHRLRTEQAPCFYISASIHTPTAPALLPRGSGHCADDRF